MTIIHANGIRRRDWETELVENNFVHVRNSGADKIWKYRFPGAEFMTKTSNGHDIVHPNHVSDVRKFIEARKKSHPQEFIVAQKAPPKEVQPKFAAVVPGRILTEKERSLTAVKKLLKVSPQRPYEDFLEAYKTMSYKEIGVVYELRFDEIKSLVDRWKIPKKQPGKGNRGHSAPRKKPIPQTWKAGASQHGPVITRKLTPEPEPEFNPFKHMKFREAAPRIQAGEPATGEVDYDLLAEKVARMVIAELPSPQPVDYGKLAEGTLRELIHMFIDARKWREYESKLGQ